MSQRILEILTTASVIKHAGETSWWVKGIDYDNKSYYGTYHFYPAKNQRVLSLVESQTEEGVMNITKVIKEDVSEHETILYELLKLNIAEPEDLRSLVELDKTQLEINKQQFEKGYTEGFSDALNAKQI